MDRLGRSTLTRSTSIAAAALLALSLSPAAHDAAASPTSRHRAAVADRVGEQGTAHVDVSRALLENRRKRMVVTLQFHSLHLPALREIVVGMDVNGSEPGLLVRLRPSGRTLAGHLSTAMLFSDGSSARRVSCPGMRVSLRPTRTVRLVIPRTCVRIGGDMARFHWFVTDRHGHRDANTWNESGFSPWTQRSR